MIILGDIASPTEIHSELIRSFFESLNFKEQKAVLLNLEGLIDDEYPLTDNRPVLFNHSSVLSIFEHFQTKVAALANNHTLDLPSKLFSTKELLKNRLFIPVGAGALIDLDFEEISFTESGQQVFVINACWDFLLYHQDNTNNLCKVNTIQEKKILEKVKDIKSANPYARIITYFHWSFDLEILPSPSYRLFAKDLIDNGVSLVVGCHSHCVQGGEKYKDGHMIYGLGNFFIPSGEYANGKLKFPEMSSLGWMLDWDPISNQLTNYWINSSDNKLTLITKDDFENSEIRKKYSLFEGMNDAEYLTYFRKNRRKKILIPVFNTYKPSLINSFKMSLLKTRAKSARMLAKFNLIKWQN